MFTDSINYYWPSLALFIYKRQLAFSVAASTRFCRSPSTSRLAIPFYFSAAKIDFGPITLSVFYSSWALGLPMQCLNLIFNLASYPTFYFQFFSQASQQGQATDQIGLNQLQKAKFEIYSPPLAFVTVEHKPVPRQLKCFPKTQFPTQQR